MLYDNLLRLCNEKGVSLSRVCAEIGINKSAATAWKKGGGITPATLLKLSTYFGINASDLIADSGHVVLNSGDHTIVFDVTKKDPAQSAESLLSAELSDLSDAELRDVLDFIRFKKSQREK